MIVPINVLVEDSRHRGFIIELPAPGEIITKHSPLAIEPIVDFLTAAGGAGHAETAYLSTGRVAAAALADVLARTGPTSTRRSLDSRRIVRVCVEYSDRVLDVPTLTDLCQVAHVSERRLRDAFVDTLGKPPANYLRLRQISRVHEILSRSTRATATVSRTAMDQGVKHLGRFAKRYRETFGELPSETLQRTSIDSDQSGR
jgi:AraC-like DNA-binding protein